MIRSRSVGRPLRITTIVLGLVGSMLGTGAGAATAGEPAPPEDVLSHFLCYNGAFAPFAGATVKLGDQLGIWETRVGKPQLFCNPVQKTRGEKVTPIVDIRQHLKAYRLWPDPIIPGENQVVDTNQFGVDQTLTVETTPRLLLVPTRKQPHKRPIGLDHFACHKVTNGPAIERPVRLRDQFMGFRTRVLKPILHCSPSAKVHGERVFEVQHKNAYLVCYSIERRRLVPPQTRGTGNQFERAKVRAEVASRLCVPSTSRVVDHA